MMQKVYDVIIIGAGISGLSSASLLHDAGVRDAIVLEARGRVGGRMYTLQDTIFGPTDVGAGYVGKSQYRIHEKLKKFSLPLEDVRDEGLSVMNLKNSWGTYVGTIPPLRNPLDLLDVNNVMVTLDLMALQVPVDSPWLAEKADLWDTMTLKEYSDSIVWTSSARELLEGFVRTVYTSEPCEVSLLFFLWIVHADKGLKQLANVKGGAQEQTVIGGTQQICQMMADALQCEVKLNSPVISVTYDSKGVVVEDVSGNKLKGQYLISAIPITLLNKIRFIPPLPGMKQQLIQRMPMGSIIKTFMFYHTAFWREKGYNGSFLSSAGPVAYCLDATKSNGSCPAIMGFVVADQCRQCSSMSMDERKDYIARHYSEVFKDERFSKPTGYIENNWMEEEYSGGCYNGVMPPGVLTKYGRHLRKPVGRIHFAGTETATEWIGYMDGGIEAGERAAREVMERLGVNSCQDDTTQTTGNRMLSPCASLEYTPLERHIPSISQVVIVVVLMMLFTMCILPLVTDRHSAVIYNTVLSMLAAYFFFRITFK